MMTAPSVDPELKVIRTILRLVTELYPWQRLRVLDYVRSRISDDTEDPMPPITGEVERHEKD
jgi:hypothetical protein